MFVSSSCFFLFNASVLFYLKFCGTNKRPLSKTVEPRLPWGQIQKKLGFVKRWPVGEIRLYVPPSFLESEN